MATKNSAFLRWQKITVASIAVLVVGLILLLFGLVLKEGAIGEFVEGEHYVLIEDPRRVRGDKVEVMEFFSYACVHCYNFDPILDDWVAANEAKVTFVRTPAVGTNMWRLLGRAYYAMDELGVLEQNHMPLFREFHVGRRTFDSRDSLATWIDGKGTTGTAFSTMFDSSAVDRRIQMADQMARRMRISAVPSIVVNGKYLVRVTSDIGPTRMLEVMDHLVAMETATP